MQSTNVKSLTTRSLCALSGMVGASLRLQATTPCLIAATVFDLLSIALSVRLSYSENNLSDPLGRSRHTLGLGSEVIFGMLVRSYKGAGTLQGSMPGWLRIAMSIVFGISGVLLKIGMSSLCRISAILFYLISIICGIGSDLLGCMKRLPHLALNVVLRTPRHTLLEILTPPMTLNIRKLGYCAAHHVLFFPSISVCAAGVPDFLDDLTGIASFGKVLLHVWTIKKVDKSGHGI
ncbi:hypothetical protein K439DRAFT_1543178 [Ramaria rubella]|nr:hypothetical protein K439DRAFT_1543178 [Ramaria rubella]